MVGEHLLGETHGEHQKQQVLVIVIAQRETGLLRKEVVSIVVRKDTARQTAQILPKKEKERKAVLNVERKGITKPIVLKQEKVAVALLMPVSNANQRSIWQEIVTYLINAEDVDRKDIK